MPREAMCSPSTQKPGGICFFLHFHDSAAGILKGIICELIHSFEHLRAGVKYKCSQCACLYAHMRVSMCCVMYVYACSCVYAYMYVYGSQRTASGVPQVPSTSLFLTLGHSLARD